MVSVPWTTTTPSAPESTCPCAHSATATTSDGSSHAPGAVRSVVAVSSATAASAGTLRTRSAASSDGVTPPPDAGGVMVIVPPSEPTTTRGLVPSVPMRRPSCLPPEGRWGDPP
jgi:hypothetical protein